MADYIRFVKNLIKSMRTNFIKAYRKIVTPLVKHKKKISKLDELIDVLKANNPNKWRAFEGCGKDFQHDTESTSSDEYSTEIVFTQKDSPLPYMLFITLVYLLKCKNYGREEKVAWTIPFKYKGVRFVTSYRKFGLKFFCVDSNSSKLGSEMISHLKRLTKIADRLIEPIINEQVSYGRYTLKNRCNELYKRYLFFREKADEAFKTPTPSPQCLLSQIGKQTGRSIDLFRHIREGFYYTQAMLDAYFCYLEHICILLTAFEEDFNPIKDNLVDLISVDWTPKFKRVFKPQNNSKVLKLYNSLRAIKEKYRNTFTHGAFEKKGASLFVHFPGVGAIPFTLSEFENSIHFSAFPVQENDYESICDCIDDFNTFLNEGENGRKMQILLSGLDIYFDEESRKEYINILKTEESLNEYIERESNNDDSNSNMDWS